MGPVAGARVPSTFFGAVAQWSEQGTHNPWVVGSIPTRPTRSKAHAPRPTRRAADRGTGGWQRRPPFLPPELMERFPRHNWRTVPGTNHYDVLTGEDGGAAVVRSPRDVTRSD